MDRSAFTTPWALSSFVLLVAGTGCLNRASFETDLKAAPVSQNPFAVAPELAQAPPTVNTRQGDAFRITLADRKEVCVSGQTTDDARHVKAATYILESFTTPNDQGKLASVKSSRIKIIQDTERSTNRGTMESVTVFEACFQNKDVFTANTEYLTMQPEEQHVANKLFVVWHFTREAVQAKQEKHAYDSSHGWDSRTGTFIEVMHRTPQRPRETERFEERVGSPYAGASPSSNF